MFRAQGRALVNTILGWCDLRMVNRTWGPRGFAASFRRARATGLVPRQVVDVGAARGLWTQECMEVFPEGQYFLVDPLEENRDCLSELHGQFANVNMWTGALGAQAGRLEMHVHGDQSSFLSSEYADSQDALSREVEVRTLDSFLEEERIAPPDLIKIDVQGYELEVLKGAKRCLETTELLLLEVSYQPIYERAPLAHEVIGFAGSLGFAIYDICTYSQRPLDGELAQSDILFVRRDSVLFSKPGWA
jgi:FkbM family methyltransferase